MYCKWDLPKPAQRTTKFHEKRALETDEESPSETELEPKPENNVESKPETESKPASPSPNKLTDGERRARATQEAREMLHAMNPAFRLERQADGTLENAYISESDDSENDDSESDSSEGSFRCINKYDYEADDYSSGSDDVFVPSKSPTPRGQVSLPNKGLRNETEDSESSSDDEIPNEDEQVSPISAINQLRDEGLVDEPKSSDEPEITPCVTGIDAQTYNVLAALNPGLKRHADGSLGYDDQMPITRPAHAQSLRPMEPKASGSNEGQERPWKSKLSPLQKALRSSRIDQFPISEKWEKLRRKKEFDYASLKPAPDGWQGPVVLIGDGTARRVKDTFTNDPYTSDEETMSGSDDAAEPIQEVPDDSTWK